VSTSTYNADMGRSSGPQVSLVTRGGGNQFDGSMYWHLPTHGTSSNEYFLKLSQLGAGRESEAPKLDKDIFGGSFGGPIRRNRLFFFGNFETVERAKRVAGGPRRCPPIRSVTACSCIAARRGGLPRRQRAGLLTFSHAVRRAGTGCRRPRSRGSIRSASARAAAASQYFSQYPSPNEPGLDGRTSWTTASRRRSRTIFNTFISRVDYKASESGNHNFFGRFGKQDDTINTAPQFPGRRPAQRVSSTITAFAVGYDSVLSSTNLTNSFRYGVTKIDEENSGRTTATTAFRFISAVRRAGATFTSTRATPMQNIVNDLSWLKGAHTFKVGTNLRFTRIPKERFQSAYLSATVNPSWVAGVGRNNMPGSSFCTAPMCRSAGRGDRRSGGLRRCLAEHPGRAVAATQRANYDRDGTDPSGRPSQRKIASDEYEFYVQDSWQVRPNLT
jgi:hypothetical protein